MGKIIIGSVMKVTFAAEGLDTNLTNTEVDVNAYFYGSDDPSKFVKYTKDQMTTEDDGLFCAANTSSLSSGILKCELEVSYPIEGSAEKLKQREAMNIIDDRDGKNVILIESSVGTNPTA